MLVPSLSHSPLAHITHITRSHHSHHWLTHIIYPHVSHRLTFWVVYATLIEGPIATFFLSFIPLFYELKLACMVYMLFFNGSSVIYNL